jgi:glucose-6-phosphate isomerase
MPAKIGPLAERRAWNGLATHYDSVARLHLRKLFADDPTRGERMTAEGAGLYLDYSKNRITDEALKLLFQLADECELRGRIDAMFRGDKINITEDRAVLHVALRAPKGASIIVDGENVVPEVHAVLDKMADFSNRVRRGGWRSHTRRCDERTLRPEHFEGSGYRTVAAARYASAHREVQVNSWLKAS